jgi:ubiquinone/menaquinone biosynthesis C-methylase UbiE
VGVYEDRVVPRLLNVLCGVKPLRQLRRRVCSGLTGDVVEIGFGSGLNVPFYPASVTRIAAVEPADVGWQLAAARVASSRVPVERSGLDGQHLPFADGSFDAVLSTWTMCTIPDVELALQEMRRVLKPDGALHFVEHGLAPDEHVRRWQHRLDPLQQRLLDGCHLSRPIVSLVENAGFEITTLDTFYQRGAPKPFAAESLGVAVPR